MITMNTTPTIVACAPRWAAPDLDKARLAAASGALLVIPTDTVYGIGADAANPGAVARLLAVKGRGRQKPPPVLVADPDSIDRLCADVPEAARRLARAHWPGPLTLVLRARDGLGWDLGDTGGTIALRVPDHPGALALLRMTGPMAVTSANTTGRPPATTIDQAVAYFGGAVGLYVDAGPTASSTPSTVVAFAGGAARVLRHGALGADDIAALAPLEAEGSAGEGDNAR